MMELMFLLSLLLMSNTLTPKIIVNLSLLLTMTQFTKFSYTTSQLNSFSSLDNCSASLITLTIWIFAMTVTLKPQPFQSHLLKISTMMMVSVLMTFLASNLLVLYINFEFTMLPMFILIILYGSYAERSKSAMYMLFYTVAGSLPFLLSILLQASTSMNILYLNMTEYSFYAPLLILLPFLIKLPMFSVHLWLPKAHVEAPVSGSMLLAAILLKLGAYGLIRSIPLLQIPILIKSSLVSMGLTGGVMASLACMRELDTKKLVAYSSIHHMGLLLASLIISSKISNLSTLLIMITHGLSSSSMFFSVNLIQDRLMTRNMILIKGTMLLSPTLSMWWFTNIAASMGTPPFLSVFSEILSVSNISLWSKSLIPLMSILLFLSTAYSIHLFMNLIHGTPFQYTFKPINTQEIHTSAMHMTPSLLLVLKLNLFTY